MKTADGGKLFAGWVKGEGEVEGGKRSLCKNIPCGVYVPDTASSSSTVVSVESKRGLLQENGSERAEEGIVCIKLKRHNRQQKDLQGKL